MAYEGILVLGEQNYGQIHRVTYELLGKALELGRLTGQKVECLILGGQNLSVEEICMRGAQKVYLMEGSCFNQANEIIYKDNIVQFIREYKPALILIGATAFGRSLAPRIA